MMVREMAREGKTILALAMADPRETKGIKAKEDLETVERYILQLSGTGEANV